jgi:hypothetical protein
MTTARDTMNVGVTCVGEHETLSAAAQHMREHNVGALPWKSIRSAGFRSWRSTLWSASLPKPTSPGTYPSTPQ